MYRVVRRTGLEIWDDNYGMPHVVRKARDMIIHTFICKGNSMVWIQQNAVQASKRVQYKNYDTPKKKKNLRHLQDSNLRARRHGLAY